MFSHSRTQLQWLSQFRRQLHMHPETAFAESWTTARIIETLEEIGVETHAFAGMTGAHALISGAKAGNTIGLRADMDALPLTEQNDVPYRSRNEGNMHACGHDANTAIMVGVARKIANENAAERLSGNVRFLFQPAEEHLGGASAMISRGVLENPRVDRVVAGHMAPDLPVGKAGVFRSMGYASSDRFELVIHGRGGHGGRPEECIDPIVAGAHFITQVQSIASRNVPPTKAAVVTVGKFVAGTADNIIPETAAMEGTVRTLSETVRAQVIRRLEEIAEGLQKAFDVRCEFTLTPEVPVLNCDPAVSESLFEAAERVLGHGNVSYLDPIMGSEDFAFFTELRPGAIIRLGCRNAEKGIVHPLHSPRFDIDETVLELGVNIFYDAVRRYLS